MSPTDDRLGLPIGAYGIAWYRRQDYARVLEVMADADQLPETFDKWLHRAEKALKEARNRGLLAVKAHIDPDQFVIWCRERGLNVDANARTQYAAIIARAEHREGHG
jgi:hypothetical protein